MASDPVVVAANDVLWSERNGEAVREVAIREAPVGAPSGWDPFEVWRTRVRDARRAITPSDAG